MEWNGRKSERGVQVSIKSNQSKSVNQVIEMVESKAYQKPIRNKKRKKRKWAYYVIIKYPHNITPASLFSLLVF
jgi:hypothetical protein